MKVCVRQNCNKTALAFDSEIKLIFFALNLSTHPSKMRYAMFFMVFACLCIDLLGQNLTIFRSSKNVDETTDRIIQEIKDEALVYFETVYHDEIAKQRGDTLAPTRSILFEDANLTTQLIKCQQTTALDLPLEILVWDEFGDVYIGYVDPKFMKKRFMIIGCDDTLESLSRLMLKITNNAMRDEE